MELLFENRFVPIREDYAQWVKLWRKRPSLLLLWIVFFLFGAICALAGILFLSRLSSLEKALGIALLFIAYFCFLIPFSVFKANVDESYRRNLLMTNGVPSPIALQFYSGSFLYFSASGGRSPFAYHQISSILESQNSLYLVIEKKVTLFLRKDAFTIGSYEDFKAFIAQKCPQVKIR